ncbi:unnamed protein product [Cuscuta campestris]|uniref:YLP motif-containing protein 1 n=1 Tax=Cuscuta campestris TaxID=132261 RepID=A0A484MCY4_9ASTE|nr:unnamed protein product [Cuscuta campestris]
MAYPWRPPPPQPHPSQGDCCPVCYYPHFPFCHPPPPYPPNPIPQHPPHPGHFYHRQPPLAPPQLAFDPILDHQSAPPMHPHRRPYMDRYEALPLPWNQGVNFNSNLYGSLNSKDNFVQGNAGAKRKHYDDSSESCAKSARFSVDYERRLKLIHDHGGPTDHDPGSRRDHDTIEHHGKGTIEFPDFGHGDRNQGQYELQHGQRNDHGFNDGPAYSYNNLDPRRNIMQHEQNASLGFTLENSSNGSLSDFYPKQNQFGSRRQSTVSEITPLHDSPPPLLAGTPVSSSPPRTTPSLFPIHAGASVSMPNYLPGTDAAQSYYHTIGNSKPPSGFAIESFHYASPRIGPGESEQYPARHLSSDKPTIVDAIHIFKHPHRSARPAHIVVILRGLPGSGKSYLAKMLRDLEVENGGNAPRIHSIDDYFMTEVEKVDESEVSRSAGPTKGKKSVRKKVIEYCYELEMEEAYRSSMLKAFKKTLDEGVFSLVIGMIFGMLCEIFAASFKCFVLKIYQ